MSTDTDADGDAEETTGQRLYRWRQMDREEARATLDDEEFREWEDYMDMLESADDNRADMREADHAVVSSLVAADMGELHEELDLYGNTVTVYVDLDDRVMNLKTETEGTLSDTDPEALDEDARDEVKDVMARFLAATIVELDTPHGHADFREWDDAEVERECRGIVEAWGIRATYHAMGEIVAATNETDAELEDRIQKFRDETRRGNR